MPHVGIIDPSSPAAPDPPDSNLTAPSNNCQTSVTTLEAPRLPAYDTHCGVYIDETAIAVALFSSLTFPPCTRDLGVQVANDSSTAIVPYCYWRLSDVAYITAIEIINAEHA